MSEWEPVGCKGDALARITPVCTVAQVELSGRELDLILAAMRGTPHYNRTVESMRLTRELADIRGEFQGEIRP